MKVCFVLPSVAPSGGVSAVLHHANWLATRDEFDVTIALTEQKTGFEDHPSTAFLRVIPVEQLGDHSFDVAIATWWKTAYRLFELRARRYAYFVQSLEDRFYPPRTIPHAAARITYGFPVSFITEAGWIHDVLSQARPDADCYLVENGIDKDVFSPIDEVPVADRRPLRILIEGPPEVWFKSVDEARAVVAAMDEEHETVFVVPDPTRYEPAIEGARVEGPLSAGGMAERFEWADVVLKVSRVEGMFGPPLEGFHKGATAVVWPVTGHDQYIEHGWNGIVVDWDDVRGTARWMDLLAVNRPFLHFLQRNALSTAVAWPSWKQAANSMSLALTSILDSDRSSCYSGQEIATSAEAALAPVERYLQAVGLAGGGLPEAPKTLRTRLNALAERRGMAPLRLLRRLYLRRRRLRDQ